MTTEQAAAPGAEHTHVAPDPMTAEAVIAKLAGLERAHPKLLTAFARFDTAAMADGALSRKTKELIAVAVALTTQCPHCLTVHGAMARQEGATDEELAEVAFVTAALRAGASVMHAADKVVVAPAA